MLIIYAGQKDERIMVCKKNTTGRGLDPRYTSTWQGFHAPPVPGEKSTHEAKTTGKDRREREKHQRPRGRNECLSKRSHHQSII